MERIRITDEDGIEAEITVALTKSGSKTQIDFAIDGNHIIMVFDAKAEIIDRLNMIKTVIDLWLQTFWD